uniref:Uncharacterized protein n=1 Tax=Arundo donax TaxID=35708 RepID=A0A0A9EVL8_ARUDO
MKSGAPTIIYCAWDAEATTVHCAGRGS